MCATLRGIVMWHPAEAVGISASARISKGQGYRGFLRKRAGCNFDQIRAICVIQGKRDRISLLLLAIKCFPISFNTFKTL
jgi:hypothetical protein